MTLFRRLLAPFVPVAALLGGCAAAPAETVARPAMWQVADADTRIYLFGTVHLLPEGTNWRTPRFDRAFAEADTLVLEVDMPADPAAHAGRYRALATSPGLPPILDRVSGEERPALVRLIEQAGLQPSQLDGLETWAATLALGAGLYKDSGLTAAQGVEAVLKQDAGGKRIVGLETMEEQLGHFDRLPEAEQRALLSSLLVEAQWADGRFDDLVRRWRTGDLAGIAATYAELEGSTALTDALLRQRNEAWARWIERRLETPGTVMVAVGAGHLAGEESVIRMLGDRRLRVTRIQ